MATQFERAFGSCMRKKGMTKDRAVEVAGMHPNKKAYRCPTCGRWHVGTKRRPGYGKVRAKR